MGIRTSLLLQVPGSHRITLIPGTLPFLVRGLACGRGIMFVFESEEIKGEEIISKQEVRRRTVYERFDRVCNIEFVFQVSRR